MHSPRSAVARECLSERMKQREPALRVDRLPRRTERYLEHSCSRRMVQVSYKRCHHRATVRGQKFRAEFAGIEDAI